MDGLEPPTSDFQISSQQAVTTYAQATIALPNH